jgi:hypothetical protein
MNGKIFLILASVLLVTQLSYAQSYYSCDPMCPLSALDSCYPCDDCYYCYGPGDGYFVGYGPGYGYYDDDDGPTPSDDPDLEVELTSTCEGNVVTVTSEGDPVNNADVTVFGGGPPMFSGSTGSDGETDSFEGCDGEVKIVASKSGYDSATEFVDLIDCAQCEEPECTTDDDCPDDEMCVDEECVPVPCECGEVVNHQCDEYDCCSDADCPEGQTCVDHSCQEEEGEPAPGCTSDDQCLDTEYCNIPVDATSGNCEPVSGDCGYAAAHVWVDYECGDEPGCDACPPGYVCEDHECVESELEGPDTGIVGDDAEFTATRGDDVCANCPIKYTDPTGQTGTGQTDENGNFVLPLTMEGTYKIALEGGEELTLESLPKAPPEEPEKPTVAEDDGGFTLLILLLILLFIIGFVVWLRRRKK